MLTQSHSSKPRENEVINLIKRAELNVMAMKYVNII